MSEETRKNFKILDENKKYKVPSKEESLVAVNEWMQKTSKTEYVWAIYQINIRLAQMITSTPNKYTNSYGDEIKKNAIKALSNAQLAQEIYIRDGQKNMEKFNARQGYLRASIGYLKATMTSSYIFFELVKNTNQMSISEALEKEGELALVTDRAIDFINKIIRSDKDYYKSLENRE